jgi:hypothetical protein
MVGFHGDSDGEALRPYPARGPKASLGIYRHGLAREPAKLSASGQFWGNGIPKSVPRGGCQLAKSLQARSSARLERYLDTVEADGSSPSGPTKSMTNFRRHGLRFAIFTGFCDVFCDIGPF